LKEGGESVNTISNLWRKFAKSKKYREEFVAAHVKRGIPFQARAMLKSREGWTQETLAERSGLTQGAISRALNPNYGNLTLNTIIRIAAGFDVAFIGKFVPFSELEKWFESMDEESVQVPTFEEEQTKTIAEPGSTALRNQAKASEPANSSSIEELWKAAKGYGQQPPPIPGAVIGAQKTGGLIHAALSGYPS
jgi:transcriptional regulator with XRE-family HTH domain